MARKTAALFAAIALYFARLSVAGTNDQVNADIPYGTFQNPSVNVRPRFRYWTNDASVNLSQVAIDIEEAGKLGVGGVELLGYYQYGENQLNALDYYAPLQSDWTIFGWGSPAWKKLQDTVLSTAKSNGLLVDLALSGNQGAGVPAHYDSDGLLWALRYATVDVPVGETFDGTLPGWGTNGTFISASSGLILSDNSTASTIAKSSLTDITGSVDKNGNVKIDFPDDNGLHYTIFACYYARSRYREISAQDSVATAVPQSPITTWQQNGSWVVDHFSQLGAQTVIDFWEKELLDESTKSLLKQVGHYLWEDSQEYSFATDAGLWTPLLPDAFYRSRGYKINKYMPLILNTNEGGEKTYVLDSADAGAGYLADYRQTLTELNQVYLKTLRKWANSLGMQLSAQIGYNLPEDMLASIPTLNAPECETLDFHHDVDSYRQFAGPANLAGKRILSSEAGANRYLGYKQTISNLLWDLKRSIAGSINQFVLHGSPYSGNYGNTTWPGFATFSYTYSEMHSRHQPGWEFYSDFLNYVSRNQWVAQSGVPKVDLAFWSKSLNYILMATKYTPSDLQIAGYSYEYLSPDNFALSEAFVKGGNLAPNRQAFKALVVRGNETLTTFGVSKLSEYAHAGLPIIFLGGVPSHFSTGDTAGVAAANATVARISSLKNVHTIDSYDGLADALGTLKITPRAAVSSNGTWYTTWRDQGSTSYVYVYNDATQSPAGQGFSTGNITVESTGAPFKYNAWTGEITPILTYKTESNTIVIPLELAGNQTTIIALENHHSHAFHVESIPASSLSIESTESSLSILSAYDTDPKPITLSNGTLVTLDPVLLTSFTLENWNLTVESWTSPSDMFDLNPVAARTNTTYEHITLAPWRDISSDLAQVSGRGYYSASFQWPPVSASSTRSTHTASGAFIDLGSILHTARVTINGHVLAALDITRARADISSYLVHGENSVEVVVSTPLGNALIPLWDDIQSGGLFASKTAAGLPVEADYGLLFPVNIMPYRKDTLQYKD